MWALVKTGGMQSLNVSNERHNLSHRAVLVTLLLGLAICSEFSVPL